MISQDTIDDVQRVSEADAEQYQRRQDRARKLEDVTELLKIAGITSEQREALSEKITSVFIDPIKDPYRY